MLETRLHVRARINRHVPRRLQICPRDGDLVGWLVFAGFVRLLSLLRSKWTEKSKWVSREGI